MRDLSEETEFRFFTFPNATLTVSLAPLEQARNRGQAEIRVFGNRQGMASLANILLWQWDHIERDFLPMTALPFVHREGDLCLSMRLAGEDSDSHGRLVRLDKAQQFEWAIGEESLKQLALLVHKLASSPWHEYDIVPFDEKGDAIVHFRLMDVRDWL